MGLCHSNTIDNTSHTKTTKSENLKNVLFLGTDYSGKSTLFKQIKYKCSDDIIEEADIVNFIELNIREEIYSQIIEQMRNVITHFQLLNDDKISTQLLNAIKTVSVGNDNYQHSAFIKLADSIQYIWKNDKRIYDIFTWKGQQLKEYLLDHTTEYFWNNIDRIKDNEYIPSYADIIRLRRGTSGLHDCILQIDGVKWHLFDTDGRKGQRNKWTVWLKGFEESLHTIIYTVNLNSFDEIMISYNDEDTNFRYIAIPSQVEENRMVDSIEAFDKLINHKCLVNCHIILVFTMIDLFEEKIKQTPISKCRLFTDYPQFILNVRYKSILFIICNDYSKTHKVIPMEIKDLIVLFGGFGLNLNIEALVEFNDYDLAKYYIKHKFEARNKNTNKQIHTYFINALDSLHVKEFVNKTFCK